MGHSFGGGIAPQDGTIMVGTTPVKQIMLGSTQVWPDSIYSANLYPNRDDPLASYAEGTSQGWASHRPGDLILMYVLGNSGPAVKPVFNPSGSAPNWITVTNLHTLLNGLHIVSAVATSSAHTTGLWTDAYFGTAVVLRGSGKSVGAAQGSIDEKYNMDTSAVNTDVVCPAVTLKNTSGSSILIHHAFCMKDKLESAAVGPWTAPLPAGYTSEFSFVSAFGALQVQMERLARKDVTTSDGSVVIGKTLGGPAFLGMYTSTVEVLTS